MELLQNKQKKYFQRLDQHEVECLTVYKDDAKVVDADGYADSLEKKVDYAKLLKLKEQKMRKQLNRVVIYRKALVKKKLGDL